MSPDRDRRRELEHVGDLVDRVVSAIGGTIGVGDIAVLWDEWDGVAGAAWAAATPVKLDAGVLTVAVPDGITATRLRYEAASLMERIERRLGGRVVSAVRIRVNRPTPSP